MKPFNIIQPTSWTHHRDGWNFAVSGLIQLSSPNGTLFLDWADAAFRDKININKPWVGIIHNAIDYPNEYLHKYGKGIHCLRKLVNLPIWKENQTTCRGIYTLSSHTATFLKNHSNLVEPLIHPVRDIERKWSFDLFSKKIFTLGQWLRRYHSLYELKCPWQKIIIRAGSCWDDDYRSMQKYALGNDVSIWNYVDNQQYDTILSESIVFLDLYDCAACNVLLECIIRNTPILINPLPAVVEYLGKDYPLYYKSLEEASEKATNLDTLKEANIYLSVIDKTPFSIDYFVKSIKNGKIFSKLINIKLL